MDISKWLNMSDVARRLKRSRAFAHKLRYRGTFPSVMEIGGVFVIHPQDLETYIARKNGTLTSKLVLGFCNLCAQEYPVEQLYPIAADQRSCIPCFRNQHKEPHAS